MVPKGLQIHILPAGSNEKGSGAGSVSGGGGRGGKSFLSVLRETKDSGATTGKSAGVAVDGSRPDVLDGGGLPKGLNEAGAGAETITAVGRTGKSSLSLLKKLAGAEGTPGKKLKFQVDASLLNGADGDGLVKGSNEKDIKVGIRGKRWKKLLPLLEKTVDFGGTPAETVISPKRGAEIDVHGGGELAGMMRKLFGKMGVTLGDKSMDQELLGEFSEFLMDLGFDKGAVSALMEKLSLSADQGEIKLEDVISGLSELGERDIVKEDEEEMMAVSALPYLHSILAEYGIIGGQAEGVLAKATGKSGISIPKLLSGLKEVQQEFHRMEESAGGIEFRDKSPDFSSRLSSLMERIGIPGEKKDGVPLSFDDFIVELGKMAQEKPATGNPGAGVAEGLEKIVSGLSSGKMKEPSSDMAQALGTGERKGTDLRDKAGKKENPAAVKVGKISEEKTGGVEEVLGAELETRRAVKGIGEDKAQAGVEPKSVTENKEAAPKSASADDAAMAFAEGKPADSKTAEVITRPPAEKRGLPAYVVNQVSRQLMRSAADGESELQINVKPPRLGRLQMSIDKSAEGLKVSIIAEHQAARDMLLAHSGELRTTLAEQGMRVDSINVELSRNFDQTLADMRRDQGSGKRRGGRGGGSRSGMGGDDLAGGGIERAARLDRGDLDLVA